MYETDYGMANGTLSDRNVHPSGSGNVNERNGIT